MLSSNSCRNSLIISTLLISNVSYVRTWVTRKYESWRVDIRIYTDIRKLDGWYSSTPYFRMHVRPWVSRAIASWRVDNWIPASNRENRHLLGAPFFCAPNQWHDEPVIVLIHSAFSGRQPKFCQYPEYFLHSPRPTTDPSPSPRNSPDCWSAL